MLTTLVPRSKVLIIDDESYIREFVGEVLSAEYQVFFSQGGKENILEMVQRGSPDLIVLDLIMPKLDGFKVCEMLRSDPATKSVPIVVLSALSDSASRMKAFSAGADDYIEKPFRTNELLLRVKTRLEKITNPRPPKKISCGNLILNRAGRTVKVGGQVVSIFEIEAAILELLILNKGEICSRETIAASIWKEGDVNMRNLDPHVSSLRKKVEGFDHSIQTVYGVGYVLRRSDA